MSLLESKAASRLTVIAILMIIGMSYFIYKRTAKSGETDGGNKPVAAETDSGNEGG